MFSHLLAMARAEPPTVVSASAWDFGWTALATIFTAVAAGATAIYAYLVKRQLGQSNDEQALTREALDMQHAQNEAEAARRERTQAVLVGVFTEHTSDGYSFIIRNDSAAVILEARPFTVTKQGNSWRSPRPRYMEPHSTANEVARSNDVNKAVHAGLTSGFTFRDNAGVRWIKWGSGLLERDDSDNAAGLLSTDALARIQPGYVS